MKGKKKRKIEKKERKKEMLSFLQARENAGNQVTTGLGFTFD